MPQLKLHIVSFDIPYPPDYGGAIDVYYKVKNLAEAGVEIYLHCPQYGQRTPSDQLKRLCKEVWYYPRKTGIVSISLLLPYTVYSRRSDELLNNLVAIDAPILFDGVSASYYLNHRSLAKRHKILRNQNVEQDYFELLGIREKNLFKKVYYLLEAKLLKHYENRLCHADAFFTVALHDYQFFQHKYPKAVHKYIPSFQPYDKVESKRGSGDYAVYHGNLSLAENKEAALFLLRRVIPHLDIPFVITGRNPDNELLKLAANLPNCKIVANPTMTEMSEIISNAQMQVLPTFQSTGLKLKLLHALFNGRHVVVNDVMVHGTGLAEICNVVRSSEEMIKNINALKEKPFSDTEIEYRKNTLLKHYDNKKNALEIITYLLQISP